MRTASAFVAATAAALTLVGTAGAASAETESAQETIQRLRAQGYSVVLDRVGSAQLSDCVVTGFRNERVITQGIPVGPAADDRHYGDLGNTGSVISRSITVSLDCSSA